MINKITALYPFDYANGSLEFAVRVLEAIRAGIDVSELKDTYDRWISEIRIAPGKFRRHPANEKQSSHDEWLGLAILSAVFDNGEVAREIIKNITLSNCYLWKTGIAHDSFKLLGKEYPIDSEYFVYWRFEYAAIMQLAAGNKLGPLEYVFLRGNLEKSTTWNLLRARILFLEDVVKYDTVFTKRASERMGTDYRGRYGSEPVINELWSIQDNKPV